MFKSGVYVPTPDWAIGQLLAAVFFGLSFLLGFAAVCVSLMVPEFSVVEGYSLQDLTGTSMFVVVLSGVTLFFTSRP